MTVKDLEKLIEEAKKLKINNLSIDGDSWAMGFIHDDKDCVLDSFDYNFNEEKWEKFNSY